MFGMTRRDLYAIYIGSSLTVMLLAFMSGASTLFLFGGLMLAFDIYLFRSEVNKPKGEEEK